MFCDGRVIALSLTLLLLTGCHSGADIPAFGASGYLADRGVVRLWRKNTPPDDIAIRTLYTPFDQDISEQTDYQWHSGDLIMVKRQVRAASSDTVTLRFDRKGNVSFMQRQLAEHREPVSQDSIDLYRFDAQRILQISNGLEAGRVTLHQGVWQQNNRVMTCDRQQIPADLESNAQRMIERQQSHQTAPVYIAWLTAPEGTQLLTVTAKNLCQGVPAEDDL